MKVKVLLKHDVADLGRIGDVVDVAPGFARNYLLPQQLALEVTPGTMQAIDAAKKKREMIDADRRSSAEKLAEAVSGAGVLTMQVLVSKAGTMYGSVAPVNVVAALAEKGVELNESAIRMSEHIKSLGEQTVTVRVHPEIEVEVKLDVVAVEGEAPVSEDDDDDEDDNDNYDVYEGDDD